MPSERKRRPERQLLAIMGTTNAIANAIREALAASPLLSDAIIINPHKIDDADMGEVWQVELRLPSEGNEWEIFRIDIYQTYPE